MICDDEEWTPQLFYYADQIGFVKRNGYVIRKLETSVTGKQDESTYLKKITDRSSVSAMLMEKFENLSGVSNAQKRILYQKFYSFICMSYYSLFHDVNLSECKQTVRILMENYQKIRPFVKYLGVKDVIRYWSANARLHLIISRNPE